MESGLIFLPQNAPGHSLSQTVIRRILVPGDEKVVPTLSSSTSRRGPWDPFAGVQGY